MYHRIIKGLSQIAHLGLLMLIPILIGTLGGAWLDQRFHTQPLWTLAGAVAGAAAAFRNLYVWAGKQATPPGHRLTDAPENGTGKDAEPK